MQFPEFLFAATVGAIFGYIAGRFKRIGQLFDLPGAGDKPKKKTPPRFRSSSRRIGR